MDAVFEAKLRQIAKQLDLIDFDNAVAAIESAADLVSILPAPEVG